MLSGGGVDRREKFTVIMRPLFGGVVGWISPGRPSIVSSAVLHIVVVVVGQKFLPSILFKSAYFCSP